MEKIGKAKENHPDMDQVNPPDVLMNKVTKASAAEQQTRASDLASRSRAHVDREHTPGVSQLTPEQRTQILQELDVPNGKSLAKIAAATGVTYEAVRHLANKTGARPERKLRMYGRRVGKRLPIPRRVELYAEVAEGSLENIKPEARLRALERMDALEGIVTLREQREGESNQLNVGPLFILPAASVPSIDVVATDVRLSQDES